MNPRQLGCLASLALASLLPASDLESVLSAYRNFDRNRDGIREIHSIGPAWFEPNRRLVPNHGTRLLLVVIEPRLLQATGGGYTTADLVGRLRDYHRRLARDGYVPYFVTADVYRGTRHQDGLTLLAMRDVFRDLRNRARSFQGAILIGSFPEAMLVRRWVWRHDGRPITIGSTTYNGKNNPKASWLGIEPEIIAERSDIVLSDLDGYWSGIYRQGPQAVERIGAIPDASAGNEWPRNNAVLTCSRYRRDTVTYRDFFFIDDADYAVHERSSARLRLRANPNPRRPEVGWLERVFAANPIARPDILVSRINPWHVGVAQDSRFLDSRGRPAVALKPSTGYVNHLYRRDPATERRLLIEYLDRNLAHRVGARRVNGHRAAMLSTTLHTFPRDFDGTSSTFRSAVSFKSATAVDFARFLKTPAVLKGISAHSNASISDLVPGYSQTDLRAETGGAYWYWASWSNLVYPTYGHDNVRDKAGFPLLRTLWQNGKLRSAGPTFYVHAGCQANSVHNANQERYSSDRYAGHQQLAENLLFYGNGLAILSRAKVFNDAPEGFAASFGRSGGRFGDALREYSRIDSQDSSLARDVAGYDKTYFWSILGDWTLRLDYTHGRTDSVATLYTHSGYGGPSISLPVGRYDLTMLESSIGNDVLSSLTVARGFQVRLFRHSRFVSQGAVLRGNAASLGAMNDQTSSLIVEPVDQGGVRLFQHSGYRGPSVALDVGNYDLNTLVNTIGNDQLTSLTVQPGYEVRLYYGSGFRGGPLVLRNSTSYLGSWNDIVSSLTVRRIY